MLTLLLKILRSEAGYTSLIGGALGLISNIAGGSKKNKGGKYNQTGEEKNLANATTALFPARQRLYDVTNEQYPYIQQSQEAAKQGGLFGAISDAFNPNPTTTEQQAITGQTRQLRNQILNSGAQGGLLRSQLADASRAGAANRLALMENARQQAAQRGFQAFLPTEATQQSDLAHRGQELAMENLINNNWTNLADLGVRRNLAQSSANNSNQSAKGGGIGSLIGQGLGGIGGIGGMGSKGPISSAVGTKNPTFTTGGQGFGIAPFLTGASSL